MAQRTADPHDQRPISPGDSGAREETRTPTAFGLRILRLLALRTDPRSTWRSVSSGAVLCPRMLSCREQDVSKWQLFNASFRAFTY
jgi:hypothetical protein